jgi:transcriptional regulator with XRE-family HTH domain
VRAPVGSGFPTLDAALGGLITGDNVVWSCDDDGTYRPFAEGFVAAASAEGRRIVHVDLGGGPWFPADVERIDARASSRLGRPQPLADELDRIARDATVDCLVVDHLDRVARRWGPERTLAFFSHVCPNMLDAGVTAYWAVGRSAGRAVLDGVRQITQCLLSVRDGRLQVLKAEGRGEALLGIAYHLTRTGDGVEIAAPAAGGRLARGLAAVRRELGLTQAELATIAGVTPSAISQAESGTRGLALDTVVSIADRLGISVDRLVNAGGDRGYHLARHDRARRVGGDRIVALAPDATVGMRVYLVDLGAHETVEPPFEHPGVHTVVAMRGLVQVDLGGDRPVLRRGDSLVFDRVQVRAWRNLRAEPASVLWVLRDP